MQERLSEVLPGDAVQWRAEPPAHEGAHGGDWRSVAAALAEGQRPLQEDCRGEAEAV